MAEKTYGQRFARDVREAERRERAASDPWFGRRRKSGEIGRGKTKAGQSKRACRGSNWKKEF